MARLPDPYLIDDENPEWTEADFARARPASEVLPPELYAKLISGNLELRPDPDPAGTVAVDLDRQVVDAFKARRPGWQSRVNETLKKAVGL